MSERLTAVYEDNLICAFDLIDKHGQYIEDLRSELRIASQTGTLYCPECHNRLIICAGAIRKPYFRHFSLADCHTTYDLRTASGRRSYHCRRMLYDLAKESNCENVILDESRSSIFKSIMFEVDDVKVGYVYLDGRSRNYQELRINAREYKEKERKMIFFLPMKYKSKGINLTSDEVETARLNKGIIFYIDHEEKKVAIRKLYEDNHGIRQSFIKEYNIDELVINQNGDFTDDFMRMYDKKVRDERCSFSKVMRISIEDGIDDVFSDMDYVCMDSYNEIWILPHFTYSLEENQDARNNRIAYLEHINEAAGGLEYADKEALAYQVMKELNKNRNSWDWD